jgi:phage shock protein PspC (stress-responsive transcriptional regulator)
MVLADFLGWNAQEWRDTIGIVVVFFVAFPILVQGLIAYAVAQALGERRENAALSRGEDLGSSQG